MFEFYSTSLSSQKVGINTITGDQKPCSTPNFNNSDPYIEIFNHEG